MLDLKQAWKDAVSPGKWIEGRLDTEYSADSGYMAFEGSVSRIDWFLKCFSLPWIFHGVVVHLGYLVKYKMIQSKMVPLDVVTGFSQGAGMALMYALDMRDRGHECKVILFGCPRVLYTKTKPFTGYNVKMNKDIVTILPPWGKVSTTWQIKVRNKAHWWQITKCHMEYPQHF